MEERNDSPLAHGPVIEATVLTQRGLAGLAAFRRGPDAETRQGGRALRRLLVLLSALVALGTISSPAGSCG